jgi:alpha-tubulin suppressor-like RCC1 family protein
MPAGVPNEAGYHHVYIQDYYACALTENGTARCWGDASFGRTAPPANTLVELALSATHACGLTTQGAIECWGGTNFGKLPSRPGPFTTVTVGQNSACGLHRDGRIECWGFINRPLQ